MISIRIAGGWLYAMRRILATLCLALLASFIAYKAMCGANGMKVWQAKRVEAQRLQKDIDDETLKHQHLQHEVDELQQPGSSAIEREARQQLGYVRPGEHVLYEQRLRTEPRPVQPAAESQPAAAK